MNNQKARYTASISFALNLITIAKLSNNAQEAFRRHLERGPWLLREDGVILCRSDYTVVGDVHFIIDPSNIDGVSTLERLPAFFAKQMAIKEIASMQLPGLINVILGDYPFWSGECEQSKICFDSNGMYFESIRSMWEVTKGILN